MINRKRRRVTMTHSTAVLFAHFGAWLLGLASDDKAASQERSPASVQFPTGRDRLPPRDENFYWAWQYWSQ